MSFQIISYYNIYTIHLHVSTKLQSTQFRQFRTSPSFSLRRSRMFQWGPNVVQMKRLLTHGPDQWISGHQKQRDMAIFTKLTMGSSKTGAFYVGNGWVWGLLGLFLIVIVDHSRKFPTFSTSKKTGQQQRFTMKIEHERYVIKSPRYNVGIKHRVLLRQARAAWCISELPGWQ
jgi:hypothetical protein